MTYEYACAHCGHHFEAQQRISDAPLDTCPKCNEKSARRLISQGNFILKGGGWYASGYSAPATPKAAATTAPAATPTPCESGACGTGACPAATQS